MTDQTPRVAVIGAGIAGMTCAAVLRDRGIDVTAFDKSRGVGGRMATRRVSPWQWDHGMQYMTGEDQGFRSLLEALPVWSGAGEESWYVGTPSQNQLVKRLGDGIDLALQTRITGLTRRDDGSWAVEADASSDASASADGASNLTFDAVVLAVPAAQATELLPSTPVFAALARVRMNPCWALMVATPGPVDLPVAMTSPHEHIAWLAADHSKPGRPAGYGQYVLHATAEWSELNLERSGDEARDALLACFHEIAGPVEISHAVAHRWRYALTRTPLDQPFLLDTASRIGACGDWCLGARVEHGYLSGRALGERLAGILVA